MTVPSGAIVCTRPRGSSGGGNGGGSVNHSVPSAATTRSFGAEEPVVDDVLDGAVGLTRWRPGVTGS